MSRQTRAHVLLSLLIVASRLALHAAGLRFYFTLNWMWMAEPTDLRDRLFETLYYFHAFPPGMNLVTGVLLKLGGAHVEALALGLFWALGLALANAIFYLGRVSGLSTTVAWVVAAAFALIPQTIYFEHLYLYETPTTTLLCLSAVLFYRAVRRSSLAAWVSFFAVCTAIGVTRSTFHLVWFAAMVILSVAFADRRARKIVLVGACLPAMVLVGLYVKNLVVFGQFAASTFGPSSLTHITVSRLPIDVRNASIAQGKLSPVEAISPYASPREYLRLDDPEPRREWPPQLTRFEQLSVDAPNFNHWLILDFQHQRGADGIYYLTHYPMESVRAVLDGTRDLFRPSTEWHPRDRTPLSPHFQHRQVLGRYEAVYNRIVHSFPIAPFGLYMFLPVVYVWALIRVRTLRANGAAEDVARGSLLCFCLFQVVYVLAFTNVVTMFEMSRYRYQVEPFIWLMTALAVTSAWRRFPARAA